MTLDIHACSIEDYLGRLPVLEHADSMQSGSLIGEKKAKTIAAGVTSQAFEQPKVDPSCRLASPVTGKRKSTSRPVRRGALKPFRRRNWELEPHPLGVS